MISNEQSLPPDRGHHSLPTPPVQEQTLKSERVQIERKMIVCELKENPRGRFLRISEEAGSHRNSVIIPATGLGEFREILNKMIEASKEMPRTTEM